MFFLFYDFEPVRGPGCRRGFGPAVGRDPAPVSCEFVGAVALGAEVQVAQEFGIITRDTAAIRIVCAVAKVTRYFAVRARRPIPLAFPAFRARDAAPTSCPVFRVSSAETVGCITSDAVWPGELRDLFLTHVPVVVQRPEPLGVERVVVVP